MGINGDKISNFRMKQEKSGRFLGQKTMKIPKNGEKW